MNDFENMEELENYVDEEIEPAEETENSGVDSEDNSLSELNMLTLEDLPLSEFAAVGFGSTFLLLLTSLFVAKIVKIFSNL